MIRPSLQMDLTRKRVNLDYLFSDSDYGQLIFANQSCLQEEKLKISMHRPFTRVDEQVNHKIVPSQFIFPDVCMRFLNSYQL